MSGSGWRLDCFSGSGSDRGSDLSSRTVALLGLGGDEVPGLSTRYFSIVLCTYIRLRMWKCTTLGCRPVYVNTLLGGSGNPSSVLRRCWSCFGVVFCIILLENESVD